MRRVDAETGKPTPSRTLTQGTSAPQHTPATPAATRGPALLGRLAVPAAVLTTVAGAFAYVGSVDPNEPGHYPVCPLLRFTGVLCPGCGGLRSAHAFVHGDLPTALQANAPAVLAYLGLAVLWTVWVVRAARGRPMRIDLGPVHLWAAGALMLTFTVVRNLPFGGWLRP
ncbi:DUF2752 domain-containing protein [Streptomyces sp. M92]|uniref:DUF2752 domain-containing protein n=1 Tax=Streptomyces sp. M92 TaxID=2944250 RepID=UPI00234976E5|nr:DUF2752 domain-containing protein [Streptomyces sp. M92]WCN00811.1 DUF2752 domain-containing protein [Streptomyces sp. M92]